MIKFITQTILIITLFSTASFAMEVPIYDFPIDAYSQKTEEHLGAESKPLLSKEYQKAMLMQFYNHYYSSNNDGLSPWSAAMVRAALPRVFKIEVDLLEDFNNQNKPNEQKHFGLNFKEHDVSWWTGIKNNMDLDHLPTTAFDENKRAISVSNTYARALPEKAPDFLHASLPGQGFPFDNLQESAIWAGTPLYVFHTSLDKAWSLVLTPDGYFAWVMSQDIAYVSPEFMQQWQLGAQKQLLAITKTETPIVNKGGQLQFLSYMGAVFPLVQRDEEQTKLLIPIKNRDNQAVIAHGFIDSKQGILMPLTASAKNMSALINQLKNRPYGWGGAYFFNDCSQEMKSLFTPLGIWLPRNSMQQSRLNAAEDLSTNTTDERILLLKKQGRPLLTLVYVGGHILLYVGTHKDTVMTYQNVWGMAPANPDKRYVIGQSLFIPMLKNYPESADISSFASRKYFKLVHLDTLETKTESQAAFVGTFFPRT